MTCSNDINILATEIKEYAQYLSELGVEMLDCDLPENSIAVQIATPKISEIKLEKFERYVPTEPIAKVVTPSVVKEEITSTRLNISSLPSLSDRKIPRSSSTIQKATVMSPKIEEKSTSDSTTVEATTALPISDESVLDIQNEIGQDCKRCPLGSQGRSKVVHTTGNFNTELMFIGEAPGADEDEQGKPFVGRAGQLLTKIIESIGFDRADVCIGNINRCRPPDNRKPVPVETAACRPYILREVAVIKPKVIVVLGATAAHNLLNIKTPIGQIRGQFHDYFGVKVMPTFHPAYLLRDPHKKREVWEDMKKVRDFLAENK